MNAHSDFGSRLNKYFGWDDIDRIELKLTVSNLMFIFLAVLFIWNNQ